MAELKSCPFCGGTEAYLIDGGTYCTEIDEEQILDLIKRLKAENERLKSDNDILSKNLHNLCKELEAEKIRNF